MKHVTIIQLNDSDRELLNKCLDVMTTFIMALHGDLGNAQDADNVKYIIDRPKEVEALITKLNKDLLK